MPIYTRRGDTGETGLADGSRVKKDNPAIILLGTIDELNASIGVAATFMKIWPEKHHLEQRASLTGILKQIQNDLFHLGSMVAGAKIQPLPLKQRTKYWEQVIDGIDVQLPPLKNFVLPGGSRVAALLHLSRSVCRRCERVAVLLCEKTQGDAGPSPLYADAVQYLNRLGDLLFVLARLVNKLRNAKETIWNTQTAESAVAAAQGSTDQEEEPDYSDVIVFEEHDALEERWEEAS